MKKLLALVLALVMTLGLATVGTNAAVDTKLNDADKIDDKYVEAVDVLKAIDVMVGDEKGNFNPTEKLTRAQGAKIVAYLIATNKVAENLSGFGTKFSDVPATHWASGMIEYCAANSILSGYNGKFDPDGGLTVVAFAKLMLTALGYDAKAEGFVDSADWATHVMTKATTAGVLEGLKDLKATDVITREQAAQMAFNTIKAPLVEYTNKGSSISVNGAEIAFGASEAKPMTSDALKAQTISYRRVNAGQTNSPYVVEFAEQYYPGLVLDITDTDVFGRPTNTWTCNRKEVGSYVRLDTKVAEWTDFVSGKTVWTAAGGATVENWFHDYYVDGLYLTADTAPKWAAVNNEIDKANTDDISLSYRGVLTELYVDEDNAIVTVVFINTYLGIAQADYNTKTEVTPITYYTSRQAGATAGAAPIAITASERVGSDDGDFALVKDLKAGDVVKANRAWIPEDAAYETVAISMAEVVENVTVTGYTTGKTGTDDQNDKALISVTTPSDTYKRSAKAYYDPEYLWNYNDQRQQLKDASYNLYLDAYGYLLGIEPVEVANQYLFVVGYEVGATVLASAIDKALVIKTDGTMETVQIKDDNLHVWNNATYTWDKAPFGASDAAVNRWYTYTVKDNIYYLDKEVFNQGVDAKNFDDAVSISGTFADLTTHNPYVAKAGDAATPAAYGNANSVYITVKADGTTVAGGLGTIVKVTGITTGIKNTNIKMQAMDNTALTNFDYSAGTTFRTNNVGSAYVAGTPATHNPANVFFIYNNSGYVTYAVAIGEDAGAYKNKVFFASTPTGRQYDKDADAYYVTYTAIIGGELTTVKVEDSVATLANPQPKDLFQAVTNKNGWIIGLNNTATDNTEFADSAVMNTTANKIGYVQKTGTQDDPVTLTLKGATLWVTTEAVNDNYVVIADNCKVFGKVYGTSKWSEFDSVESLIGSLTRNDNLAFISKVTAICDPITGYATTLVVTQEKKTAAEAAAPAAGVYATGVDATIAEAAASTTGTALKLENAYVTGGNVLVMNYLASASVPTQITEALTKLGYTVGDITKTGGVYAVKVTKDGVAEVVTMILDDDTTAGRSTAYYPVKVDGTVVAYLKDTETYDVTGTAGTGYVVTKGLAAASLDKYVAYTTDVTVNTGDLYAVSGTEIALTTGYVKVADATTDIGTTDADLRLVVDGTIVVNDGANKFAKVGSTLTYEAFVATGNSLAAGTITFTAGTNSTVSGSATAAVSAVTTATAETVVATFKATIAENSTADVAAASAAHA